MQYSVIQVYVRKKLMAVRLKTERLKKLEKIAVCVGLPVKGAFQAISAADCKDFFFSAKYASSFMGMLSCTRHPDHGRIRPCN